MERANAFSGMIDNEAGMTIEVREEQPEKLYLPISVNEVKSVDCKELHPLNAISPMEVTDARSTEARFEASQKAPIAMRVTLAGMLIVCNSVHSLNASYEWER